MRRAASQRVLLALLLVFPLAGAAPGAGDVVLIERQVFDIARQLRCPICVSESVAASSSQIAITMRQEIQELLNEGLSEAEILASFQAAYGDWILLEPPRRGLHLLVWLLPVVVAAAGAVLLYGFVRRSVKAGNEEVKVDEADLERLRHELGKREDPA